MNGLDILYTACADNKMHCRECPMYIYAIMNKLDPMQFDCKELYELMVFGRITEEL